MEAERTAGQAFSLLGWREAALGGLVSWVWSSVPGPVPWSPPSFPHICCRKWLWGWVGSEQRGGSCEAAVCTSVLGALTIPSLQCRCGQRHQPIHAPPWGAVQKRGQEVRKEFLPKKGASLSTHTWSFPPQRFPPEEPQDSVPLSSNSSAASSETVSTLPSSTSCR